MDLLSIIPIVAAAAALFFSLRKVFDSHRAFAEVRQALTPDRERLLRELLSIHMDNLGKRLSNALAENVRVSSGATEFRVDLEARAALTKQIEALRALRLSDNALKDAIHTSSAGTDDAEAWAALSRQIEARMLQLKLSEHALKLTLEELKQDSVQARANVAKRLLAG